MDECASRLTAAAAWLRGLTGWHRWLAAFGFGLLGALALPPLYFWPLLIVSFSGFVALLDGVYTTANRPKEGATTDLRLTSNAVQIAAGLGWWFGFGYFLAGLYWIAWAFLVDAETFAWLIPFAATIMPSGLALFTALVAAIAMRFWRPGAHRIVLVAALWTMFEWLRGHIFTGLPWNLTGYAAAQSLPLSQSASVFGIYGLSFLCVAAASSFVALADTSRPLRARTGPPALSVAAIAVCIVFGAVRLAITPTETVDGVGLRIVQPSFTQKEKWLPQNRQAIIDEYLTLTRAPGYETRTHFVWPEAALPVALTASPSVLQTVVDQLGPGKTLITGAVRAQSDALDRYTFYNAVHVIEGADTSPENPGNRDPQAHVLATYDKHHLVPFGEYVPFSNIFRALGLQPIVDQIDGFSAGPSRKTLPVPGAPNVSPLICYEIIFPGAITAPRAQQKSTGAPEWIVNVTNDAWYGDTSGPRQHLEKARMRAIESGLPVVRAGNTGISAVIDGLGRPLGQLDLNVRGVLDTALPKRQPATLYGFWGDIPVLAIVLGVIGMALIRTRSLNQKPPANMDGDQSYEER